jgi:hypothetical protein
MADPLTDHLLLRDARDRISELLRIGTPYPLQDLPVPDEQLTVPFNNVAYVPIQFSQRGVFYTLYYDGKPVKDSSTGEPIEAEGNGEILTLETHKITDDITFQIFARKRTSKNSALLHQTATIKVGLAAALRAWIISAPPLDTTITDPSSTAARIVAYGDTVTVELENSQEGVLYQLVAVDDAQEGRTTSISSISSLKPLSARTTLGTGNNITLESVALQEDTVIAIRATKDYEETNKPPDEILLTVRLPIKVRANANLTIGANPAIAAFEGNTTLVIANTQQSVTYQVVAHAIRDAEFIHDSATIRGAIEVADGVWVILPREADQIPDGYVPIGEAVRGTGGDLEIPLDSLTADSVYIVTASKAHEVGTTDDGAPVVIPTTIRLRNEASVVVEPNPEQRLTVKIPLVRYPENPTGGMVHVLNGEPGVYYTFADENGKDIAAPAYFHKRDDVDGTLNKGLDQLKIEVDFAIPRDYPSGTVPDLSRETPPYPILDTDALQTGTRLTIRAVKAQTRVGIAMPDTIVLSELPTLRMQDPVVNYNGETKILVENSIAGEKYQPFLNGEPFKRALNGDGDLVSFNTDKLQQDTEYELRITVDRGKGIIYERSVPLRVYVRPNARLSVSADRDTLQAGEQARITIEGSQQGVRYQLTVADAPHGEPMIGDGGTIALTSAPLSADTAFAVRATRSDMPELSVQLATGVNITVQAGSTSAVK